MRPSPRMNGIKVCRSDLARITSGPYHALAPCTWRLEAPSPANAGKTSNSISNGDTPTRSTRFRRQQLIGRAQSAIRSASRPTGGSLPVMRRRALAFMLAIAASAVLPLAVWAAGQPTLLEQTTEIPCPAGTVCTAPRTQPQCADASAASQCAGQIDLQDPALTRDRVHVTGPWWQWLMWLVLGGSFVGLGFRRPLLRVLRAARAETEETVYKAPMRPSLSAAPEADKAQDSHRELGRPKSTR
jgi:hypothetical protein